MEQATEASSDHAFVEFMDLCKCRAMPPAGVAFFFSLTTTVERRADHLHGEQSGLAL